MDALESPREVSTHERVNSAPTGHTFFSCTVVVQSSCHRFHALISRVHHAWLQNCGAHVCVFPQNIHASSRNVVCHALLDDTKRGHPFLTYPETVPSASTNTAQIYGPSWVALGLSPDPSQNECFSGLSGRQCLQSWKRQSRWKGKACHWIMARRH